MKSPLKLLSCVAWLVFPTMAHASDWTIEANVQTLEPSYVPNLVVFAVNATGGSCAAGNWLSWGAVGPDYASRAQNVQAVMATLLTALATGKKVRLYGRNTDCSIEHIHLLN